VQAVAPWATAPRVRRLHRARSRRARCTRGHGPGTAAGRRPPRALRVALTPRSCRAPARSRGVSTARASRGPDRRRDRMSSRCRRRPWAFQRPAIFSSRGSSGRRSWSSPVPPPPPAWRARRIRAPQRSSRRDRAEDDQRPRGAGRPLLRRRGHHRGGDPGPQREGAAVPRRVRVGAGRERARHHPALHRRRACPALLPRPFTQPDGSTGTHLYIDPAKFRSAFAGPLATAPAWKTISSWYLVGSQDEASDPAAERFMAKRAGAHTVEMRPSHVSYISHAGAVTALIRPRRAGGASCVCGRRLR
jgi:hypothetical protein